MNVLGEKHHSIYQSHGLLFLNHKKYLETSKALKEFHSPKQTNITDDQGHVYVAEQAFDIKREMNTFWFSSMVLKVHNGKLQRKK